jgi:DNA-binding NtrC family response regulator
MKQTRLDESSHWSRPADPDQEKRTRPATAMSITKFLENSHPTILLVEDEASVRKVTSLMLARNGCEVLQAANAEEALSISSDEKIHIDVLVTDMVLPGSSGRNLAEEIHRRRPDIKVLFMSGYTNHFHEFEESMTLRAAFIGKPFTWAAFLAKLGKIMDVEERS